MRLSAISCIAVLLFSLHSSFAQANVKWEVGATASTAYDDNVTYRKDDKIGDVVSRVTLGGGVNLEGRTEKYSLKTAITGNIYGHNSDFNNLSEDLYFNANKDFSENDNLKFSNSFRHAQEPRRFEDDFGRASNRSEFYRNNLNMLYGHMLSKETILRLKYSQDNYVNKAATDSVSYSPGFQAEYSLNNNNHLLFDYDFSRRFFDPGGATNSHDFAGGLRHFFSKQWYVDIKPGFSIVQSSANSDTTVEPRYEIALTGDVDENTNLSARFLKSSSINSFDQNLFDSWKFSLSGNKQLSSRFAGQLTLFFGQGEYSVSNVEDTNMGGSASLQYLLSEEANVYLTYSNEKVDSNVSTREFTRNIYSLGVKASF